MRVVDPALRLSAQRALLGAISPEVRLVKVSRIGAEIVLTTLTSEPLRPAALDAIETAASEIIADFPDCQIRGVVEVSLEKLPVENVLSAGWVFKRLE